MSSAKNSANSGVAKPGSERQRNSLARYLRVAPISDGAVAAGSDPIGVAVAGQDRCDVPVRQALEFGKVHVQPLRFGDVGHRILESVTGKQRSSSRQIGGEAAETMNVQRTQLDIDGADPQ